MLKLVIKTKQDAIDALKSIASWLVTESEQEPNDTVENSDSTAPYLDAFNFIDLGLPSGKLWATENVKDKNGNETYFTFDEAVEQFGDNLPSKEDWQELFDHCNRKWDEEKKGYILTGQNGNTIFLPAAGNRYGTSVLDAGSSGYYWSSSVYNENFAYYVDFYSGNLYPQGSNFRYRGFSVRLARAR